jgi:outer membrane protein TolC
MAGNFDLMEAETELREAEIGLISAVIGYIVGSYRLRTAMGTLVDKEGRVSF